MRKAVSPLVAAVLLIAATMSIAGILAYWASSFVRTQTVAWENQTVTGECNFADFKVYSCSYNSSALKMNLILENIRTVELKDLKAYVFYANDSISAIALNETLPAGAVKPFYLTNVESTFSKILIKTQCPEVTKESVCR